MCFASFSISRLHGDDRQSTPQVTTVDGITIATNFADRSYTMKTRLLLRWLRRMLIEISYLTSTSVLDWTDLLGLKKKVPLYSLRRPQLHLCQLRQTALRASLLVEIIA